MVKSHALLGKLTKEDIVQYLGFLNGGISMLGLLILDSTNTCEINNTTKRILGWMPDEMDDMYSLFLHYNINHRK